MAAELAVVQVETKALSLRDQARAIIVKDQVAHDAATELYLGLSALEKEINAVHDPAISAAHAAHKAALAAKGKSADPVAEAKKIIKPKITAWEQEQERIRQELERKAREEAAKREEEARLALAVEAEKMEAPPEVVEQILATPLPTPAPVVAPTFQKTKGFTSRPNYSCSVVNLQELVKAAAANPNLLCYLQPNEVALGALARSMKDAFTLPGCKLIKTIV